MQVELLKEMETRPALRRFGMLFCVLGIFVWCAQTVRVSERRKLTRLIHRFATVYCLYPAARPFGQMPEELLKPSYLLLEPVRYTLAEILRLCRRPMVLPGPLVRCMLQDLLGAVAICHDRDVVIKSLDAEKVGCTYRILFCTRPRRRGQAPYIHSRCAFFFVRSHTCFEEAYVLNMSLEPFAWRCRFAQKTFFATLPHC